MLYFFSGNGSFYFETIDQTGGDGGCALIHLLSKLHKVENYRNLFLSLLRIKQFYEGYNGFYKIFCITKKWKKNSFYIYFSLCVALGINGLIKVIQIIMNCNNAPV